MHVVLVADHAAINGGQAKVAIESALGLAARGIRVSLFAAVGPVKGEGSCCGDAPKPMGSTGGRAGKFWDIFWHSVHR